MAETYELPFSWPAKDTVEWIRETLREPGVKSVEIKLGERTFIATVQW